MTFAPGFTIMNTGLAPFEQQTADEVAYRPDPNRPPWTFVMSWGGSAQTNVTNTVAGTDGPLGPGWWLAVHAHAWDVNTGEPVEFVHNLPMWLPVNPTRHEILHEITRLVIMVQTHEVLEHLQTAAGRVCDPHGTPQPLYHLPGS